MRCRKQAPLVAEQAELREESAEGDTFQKRKGVTAGGSIVEPGEGRLQTGLL